MNKIYSSKVRTPTEKEKEELYKLIGKEVLVWNDNEECPSDIYRGILLSINKDKETFWGGFWFVLDKTKIKRVKSNPRIKTEDDFRGNWR